MRRGAAERLFGCLLCLCLLTTGCTKTERSSSSGADPTPSAPAASPQPVIGTAIAIEFRSEPDPPRSGDNRLEVIVKQPDGNPVTDAKVETVFSMPAMPSMNMPAMRSVTRLEHVGAGRYRGTGQLSMGGTWNVIVSVTRGGDELGNRRLSVVAK